MRINPHLKEDLKKYLIEKIRKEKNAVKVMSGYRLGTVEKQLLHKKFDQLDWNSAQYEIDESLIAGVVITVGSRVIDLSLKGSLLSLKHIIYESD